METLSIVITEILISLGLAWILGFVAAWLISKKTSNKYQKKIDDLEENFSYIRSCNMNQEREITQQSLKIQEYKDLLSIDVAKKNNPNKKGPKVTQMKKAEDVILERIGENLSTLNKQLV